MLANYGKRTNTGTVLVALAAQTHFEGGIKNLLMEVVGCCMLKHVCVMADVSQRAAEQLFLCRVSALS